MNGQAEVEVDYKRKYKNLKRKLKFIVYVSIVFFSVRFFICRFKMLLNPLYSFLCSGARVFSGGAEKSSEETIKSFKRQKVVEPLVFLFKFSNASHLLLPQMHDAHNY